MSEMNSNGLERSDYPRCPRCGGPVAGAMMTSQSIDLGFGTTPRMTYYHPDAITVYCVSASCNWDHKLSELTTPVPGPQEQP
jgi:hypothetical protein